MTKTKFAFVEKRNLWYAFSLILIIAGISLMIGRSIKSQPALNYGIDFLGGSSILIKIPEFEKNIKNTPNATQEEIDTISSIRDTLSKQGLEKSQIQITTDKEILIKTLKLNQEKSQLLLQNLKETYIKLEILEVDFIGPTIGEELKNKSFLIILIVSISLLLYITLRFELIFGISALIALLHDALIVISFASLFKIEINTAFVAAILTILGYSINDTIVIFDRIRENYAPLKDKHSFKDIINLSLNQTLVRTLNTSVTTMLVIGSLIIFGGTTIKPFCVILLIGIIAGTYSSLFIASPTLSLLKKTTL